MEIGFDPTRFRWLGVPERAYKFREGDERGMGWSEITRHTLAKSDEIGAGFELRYFELAARLSEAERELSTAAKA